jgi:ABC-type bacteriocin/lantibiotic exporter with double-glycine peptidase domain
MENSSKNSLCPYRFILKDKYGLFFLLAILIQQILSASSTYWILKVSENVVEQRPFFYSLIFYLSSLLLPYIPMGIADVLSAVWEQSLVKKYLYRFMDVHSHQTALWSDKKKKEEFISTVNHESLQTINTTISYYYQLASDGLNAFLNILAIGFFVDYFFIYSYVFSLLLSFVLIKIQSKKQKNLSEKAQLSRIELGKSILSFWDNAVLGNTYNLKFWRRDAENRLNQSVKDNIDSSIFQELISVGISVVTFLPSILTAAYGMYKHVGDPIILAAFVVIMSKLFVILTHTYDLLYWIVHLSAMNAKVEKILSILTPPKTPSTSAFIPRIDWSSITLESNAASYLGPWLSFTHFHELSQTPGRVTIKGRNGCGKSSLLLELKHQFKEEAFYLPCHNHLDFSFTKKEYSTGELLKEQLLEVYHHVEAKIILLDEWNANLDAPNQAMLSEIIDQIAQKKCVIEVTHR